MRILGRIRTEGRRPSVARMAVAAVQDRLDSFVVSSLLAERPLTLDVINATRYG